ncbi:SDR family NAD(P)-dependent oxidoreductase [Lutimonas sp.]|uniref:SDR family NAD(P)-dependent oxidoreductase n=1 Tax=Lutimonas sp. TaxID=1872403 RepID=UPI003D9ADA99
MKNQLILITGGSSGIGKAAAALLYDQGARIILQARDPKKLETVAREIDPTSKKVSYYSTDLTEQEAVENTANEILVNEGLPDVIINSAGAGEWLSLKESDASYYKSSMDSPYLATAYTCKIFFDKMQERGTGQFIIINSAASYFAFPGATGYTPARWAMLGFAKSLQADLYDTKFKVSLIVLGKVDSPYFKNNPVSEERIPKIANWLTPTMSVESAARIISSSIKSKPNVVVRPFMMSIFVFLNRFIPGVFSWLMRITSYKK